MYARLTANYRARYSNPIAVVAGEKVTLGILADEQSQLNLWQLGQQLIQP